MLLLVGLSVCCFAYLIIGLKSKWSKLKNDVQLLSPYIDNNQDRNQTYFIDLKGCRIPYFPVIDEHIIQYIYKPRKFECQVPLTSTKTTQNGTSYIFLNINDTKALKILYNIENIMHIDCSYREVQRINDKKNSYLKSSTKFQLQPNAMIEIPPNIEFIRVDCWSPTTNNRNYTNSIYKDFHYFAIKKSTAFIDEEVNQYINKDKSRTTSNSYETNDFQGSENETNYGKLNYQSLYLFMNSKKKSKNHIKSLLKRSLSVMILGLGSLSQLNFQRQMPLTASYIKKNLDHVTFWGYNTIAENLYPNLVSLLSGLESSELNLACPAMKNYDNCTFIWQNYRKAGFTTILAEDVNAGGFLSYLKRGFKLPPTDYYLQPILNEMEKYIGQKKKGQFYQCLGGRRSSKVLFDYIRQISPFMIKRKFFSFFWSTTTTHNEFNVPLTQDVDLKSLLANDLLMPASTCHSHNSIMNKTIIFLISDHGSRESSFSGTYQGAYEKRLPLFICIYPKWFKLQFPLAVQHLQDNSKRLVTPYDIHSTLIDLLDLRKLNSYQLKQRTAAIDEKDNISQRGISLFLPISKTRSCESADIVAKWCACNQREQLATNDEQAQRAARFIVKVINQSLKSFPQCRILYLNAIFKAIMEIPQETIIQDNHLTKYSIDIRLRIQTKPGLAQFDSTVRMNGPDMYVTKTIDRQNIDIDSSYCIDQISLKNFCYCYR